MKILVTYPSRDDLSRIVDRTVQRDDIELSSVMDHEAIMGLRTACRHVLAAQHVRDFAIGLIMATQPGTEFTHPLATKYIRYGSSPRGAQALVECGRALALIRGRWNLAIDDIIEVAPAVLRHRVILNFDAHADGQTPETVLTRIIQATAAVVA
jgi:MoxR-like ATPase